MDDVPTNRDLLDELLSRVGFTTRTAASAEEAIVVHDEWRPDLVLMDVRMPGMGGLEGVRRLRQSGSKAAIVAVTASGLADTENEAREAGVDAFVRKPYREGELLAAIGERLGVRYVYGSTVAAPVGSRGPRRRRAIDAVAAVEQPAAGADRSAAGGGDRGPRQAARIARGSGGAALGRRRRPRFERWPGTSSTTRSCRRWPSRAHDDA